MRSQTAGRGTPGKLAMQTDGNLVLYGAAGDVRARERWEWESGTKSHSLSSSWSELFFLLEQI